MSTNIHTNIDSPAASKSAAGSAGMTLGAYLRVLLVGIFFGIVLVKSEVVRWQRVHDMFLFREAHMYLIITTGIIVAGLAMQWIKRFGIKTIDGKPIVYKPKPFHKGIILGGILFGAGWAITGACPGPIYAQIGAGAWMALATLAGALAGMFVYAYAKPKLPH
ncbi:MAG TPA: YeeE/YedE thiosulfate transporter family protein [Pirellulaceae bacterium]|nr:YeeE/YedE thiosulfate transporter family protein [Pirellulaceae bacterium]HMO90570.1 YeeE/YedE thiosulfate transporter family protein [Pirellulaceae bacterium]HMP71234.1 YeeE/YedE thiosulfate transporter family protein [Pirellulaceae bacterium]